ncbi:MAG: class I SAM-dependent methyltransferase [Gaiellaceae bacterium MAG52_C11]|nr:class I SAM-dependent methyltransferase [Candidatus Gaiellasilicea maunaloa]
MSDPRAQLVADGYDSMIDTWESWKAQITDDPRKQWCAELAARLSPGARVLELGCGGGTEETRVLASGFRLTGVDLSPAQLERARRRVPDGEFRPGDFTAIDFEPGSFEGVAAFYSFNHVPRALLGDLFERIHAWLVPGGWFLATLGGSDLEDWTGEWLGVRMFFSGWPPETNRRLLAKAGFELERDELVAITEPEGKATFQWVLARR